MDTIDLNSFSVGALRRHKTLCRTIGSLASLLTIASTSAPAFAAGTDVLGGDSVLTAATRATLEQNTDTFAQFSSSKSSAVLDWSKFNIGAGKQMDFDGSGTTFFNLVDASASKSQIDGIISGNGSVWVINPNGIAFGAASRVDVGGLFAAAAGNISNADALRTGSSLLPEFSAFNADVATAAGSSFTADQVALLGKTASVAGDFTSVGDLAIVAGSKMTIEDVAGGKVSINVADFAPDVDDISVLLGDLDVGGALSVKSAGTIATATSGETASAGKQLLGTTQTGSVVQAGDISLYAFDDMDVNGELQSTGGSVSLTSYGDIDVNAAVEAYDSVSALALGDIAVAADVTANGGDSGSGGVTLYSYGNVAVNEGAKVTGAGTIGFYAGLDDSAVGNVTINGDVTSTAGSVLLYSGYGDNSTGDIAINAPVTAYDKIRGISVGDITAAADITANGGDSGSGGVTLYSYGDIAVNEGAKVNSVGAVDIAAGMDSGVVGNVTINGDITSSSGGVDLYSGYGSSSTGDLEINGDVTAAGAVDAYAGFGYGVGTDGKITVNGNITGASNIKLRTGNGDIEIGSDATIATTGFFGEIDVYTAADSGYGLMTGDGHSGDITLNGQLTANGTYGQVNVVAGKETGTSGNVTMNSSASISSDYFSQLATTDGNIDVNGGTIVSRQTVALDTMSGDINVDEDAVLTVTGNSVGASYDELYFGLDPVAPSVKVMAAMDADGTGAVTMNGIINAMVSDGTVSIETGRDANYTMNGGTGGVSVGGEIYADGTISLMTKDGDINVKDGGIVASIGQAGEVDIVSAMSEYGKGDINIKGDVGAVGTDGTTLIYAGYGVGGSGSEGSVSIEGSASAGYYTQIASMGGDVSLSKGAEVAADEVDINSTTGSIILDGSVSAIADLSVDAQSGISGVGAITVAGAPLTVHATSGDIALTGRITAGDTVAVSEGGSVSLANGRNDFSSTVLVVGDAISISDANGVTTASMTARTGDINVFTADGDVTVAEGAVVAARQGDVNLIAAMSDGAEGSVIVNGSATAAKTLRLYGGYGGEADATGGVAVNGYASGVESVAIAAFGGSVTSGADGDIASSTGPVTILAQGGDVALVGDVVGQSAVISSTSGTVGISEGAAVISSEGAISLKSAQGIDVDGSLTAPGNISLLTSDGYIWIGEEGRIAATGDGTEIKAYTGKSEGDFGGNIIVHGVVVNSGANGSVDLNSGLAYGANGSIQVSGNVSAIGEGGTVHLGAGNGESERYCDALIYGKVSGKGGVQINARDGGVTIGSDASVYSGGDMTINAEYKNIIANGTVTTLGTLSANSTRANAMFSGTVNAGKAAFTAAGDIYASNTENDFTGLVTASGATVYLADKNNIWLGPITATDYLYAWSGDGSIFSYGAISAGKATLRAGTGITAYDSISASGDVNALARGGNIVVYGDVSGDNVTLTAAKNTAIGGNVAANSDLTVAAATGLIELDGVVTADNITLTAAGNVSAYDKVSADGDIQVTSSASAVELYGDVAANNVDVAAGKNVILGVAYTEDGVEVPAGVVVADGDLAVTAGTGTILANAVAANDVTLAANKDIDVIGNIAADGDLTASGEIGFVQMRGGVSAKNVDLAAMDNVRVGGDLAADGDLSISSTDGGLQVVGEVSANNANFSAATSVFLNNSENDFTGTVTASGDDIFIADKNDILLGNISAGGGVALDELEQQYSYGIVVEAGKDITVAEGSTLRVTGDGAELQLVSYDGGVTVNGDLSSKGSLSKIEINSAYNVGTEGNVTINGGITASGESSFVNLYGGAKDPNEDIGSSGSVVVNGTVDANGNIDIQTGYEGGSITVAESGVVSAHGDDALLYMRSGYASGSTDSDITVAGTVAADGSGARVEIDNGCAENAYGNIVVSGSVAASGDGSAALIHAGANDGASGNVTVSGSVSASGDGSAVQISAADEEGSVGNVVIEKSGKVSIEGDGAELAVVSGWGSGAKGDVTVAGTIMGSGEGMFVHVRAAEGEGASGGVTIAKSGSVSAEGKDSIAYVVSGFGKDANASMTVAGNISANGENAEVDIISGMGDGSSGAVDISGDVAATGDNSRLMVWAGNGEDSHGEIDVSGNLKATGSEAAVQLAASAGKSAEGSVTISGQVLASGEKSGTRAYAGYGEDSSGSVTIAKGGLLSTDGMDGEALVVVGYDKNAVGSVDIDGTLSATGEGGNAVVIVGHGENASGSVALNGTIAANDTAQIRTSGGAVAINGSLSAGTQADVWVVSNGSTGGDISFGAGGNVTAGDAASIAADGNVTQVGNYISAKGGYVDAVGVPAAVSGSTVYFSVDGSVGGGNSYVGVSGKTYAVIGGDASIAAANGANFQGGNASAAPTAVSIAGFERTIASSDKTEGVKSDEVVIESLSRDFSALGGNSSLLARGDLSVYTSGKLEANGLLKAGDDITVSAADFGDMSYLQSGGKLTINNVGHPTNPRIAYFESIDGKEPRISNLANDMVIFVDGRLAGGNLKTINQFGANEAFIVATPELKSEQGIFGNPTFLHSDLDVANPMEVSAIDYLLQEDPRLTLDTEFPREVDQHVESVVLPERDSIIFGRASNEETPPPDAKPDEKGPGVAMN